MGLSLKDTGMQKFDFHDDPNRVDMPSLRRLYQGAGFEFPDNAVDSILDRFLPQGGFGFFAHAGDDLVGASRVFSDDLTIAWISELCVDQCYRRRRVGSTLLSMMNGRFGHVPLLTAGYRGLDGFFLKKGLSPLTKLFACGRAPL